MSSSNDIHEAAYNKLLPGDKSGLPWEIWQIILSWLSAGDLCRVASVCKTWTELVVSVDSTRWKALYLACSEWRHPFWPLNTEAEPPSWKLAYRDQYISTKFWCRRQRHEAKNMSCSVIFKKNVFQRNIHVGPGLEHENLKTALSVANDYDRIIVHPGIYDEQFEISAKIPFELIGHGELGSVILVVGIQQLATTARLSNLVLRAPWFTSFIVMINSGYLQIDNCILEDGMICAQNPSTVHIKFCTFRHATVILQHMNASIIENCEFSQSDSANVIIEGHPKDEKNWTYSFLRDRTSAIYHQKRSLHRKKHGLKATTSLTSTVHSSFTGKSLTTGYSNQPYDVISHDPSYSFDDPGASFLNPNLLGPRYLGSDREGMVGCGDLQSMYQESATPEQQSSSATKRNRDNSISLSIRSDVPQTGASEAELRKDERVYKDFAESAPFPNQKDFHSKEVTSRNFMDKNDAANHSHKMIRNNFRRKSLGSCSLQQLDEERSMKIAMDVPENLANGVMNALPSGSGGPQKGLDNLGFNGKSVSAEGRPRKFSSLKKSDRRKSVDSHVGFILDDFPKNENQIKDNETKTKEEENCRVMDILSGNEGISTSAETNTNGMPDTSNGARPKTVSTERQRPSSAEADKLTEQRKSYNETPRRKSQGNTSINKRNEEECFNLDEHKFDKMRETDSMSIKKQQGMKIDANSNHSSSPGISVGTEENSTATKSPNNESRQTGTRSTGEDSLDLAPLETCTFNLKFQNTTSHCLPDTGDKENSHLAQDNQQPSTTSGKNSASTSVSDPNTECSGSSGVTDRQNMYIINSPNVSIDNDQNVNIANNQAIRIGQAAENGHHHAEEKKNEANNSNIPSHRQEAGLAGLNDYPPGEENGMDNARAMAVLEFEHGGEVRGHHHQPIRRSQSQEIIPESDEDLSILDELGDSDDSGSGDSDPHDAMSSTTDSSDIESINYTGSDDDFSTSEESVIMLPHLKEFQMDQPNHSTSPRGVEAEITSINSECTRPVPVNVSEDTLMSSYVGQIQGCLIHQCRMNHSKGGLMISLQAHAIISECDISNVGYGIRCIQNSRVVILKNKIHHCRTSGIFMRLSSSGLIAGNDIHSNNEAGIDIRKNADPLVQFNQIHHGKRSGVVILGSGRGQIKKNDIYSNAEAGVYVLYGGNPTISENYIYEGRAAGVAINAGGKGCVVDNVIRGNHWGGIDIRNGSCPLISGNSIINGISDGIVVGAGGKGSIENNFISGNEGCGIWMMAAKHLYIHGNQICNSGHCGVMMLDKSNTSVEGHLGQLLTNVSHTTYSQYDDDFPIPEPKNHWAVLQYNNIYHNKDQGILIEIKEEVRLFYNAVHGNQKDGILMCQDAPVVVEGNSITSNSGSGIITSTHNKTNLTKNGIYDNTQHGLVCRNSCVVEENDIAGHSLCSIIVEGKSHAQIKNNRLCSSSMAAVKGEESSVIVAANNRIFDRGGGDLSCIGSLVANDNVLVRPTLVARKQAKGEFNKAEFLTNPSPRPHIAPPPPSTIIPSHHVTVVTKVSVPSSESCEQGSTLCVIL